MVSLMLVLLMGMVGLVVDGGTLYVVKSHLQKTANAAVLSAAQELTVSEGNVRDVVQQVLKKHQEEESHISTQVEMKKSVSVVLKKEVTFGFARVLGFNSAPVEVKSTAELYSMGSGSGAVPLGIDESIQLEFYKEYTLKVDETGVDHGNFGVLGLGGPGAQTYEHNLIYGYANELKVGDIIKTETGNMVDKTKNGVNRRIQMCPYPDGDYSHRDCARIILIPVYKPHNHQEGNQLKEIEITGFAYFYISKPMDDKDKSIRGMFIEVAGTGYYKPDAVARGAYVIRLTE